MTDKKRPGAPPKPDTEKKVRMNFSMSPEDKAWVETFPDRKRSKLVHNSLALMRAVLEGKVSFVMHTQDAHLAEILDSKATL